MITAVMLGSVVVLTGIASVALTSRNGVHANRTIAKEQSLYFAESGLKIATAQVDQSLQNGSDPSCHLPATAILDSAGRNIGTYQAELRDFTVERNNSSNPRTTTYRYTIIGRGTSKGHTTEVSEPGEATISIEHHPERILVCRPPEGWVEEEIEYDDPPVVTKHKGKWTEGSKRSGDDDGEDRGNGSPTPGNGTSTGNGGSSSGNSGSNSGSNNSGSGNSGSGSGGGFFGWLDRLFQNGWRRLL